MEGPATVLVNKDSATCLRTWETETRNTLAMNRTHSELVKFPNRYDAEYALIRQRLKGFALKAAEVIPKRHVTGEVQQAVKSLNAQRGTSSHTRNM